MALSRKNVAILLAASLLLALVAFALAGCNGSSASTTVPPSGQTTASSETSTSFLTTTTSDSHKGAAKTFATIGQVMEVEQGQLSVSKVTVTDDLASVAANALLLTGDSGEKKNVSKAPAAGNEFLMITFTYKKDASYAFRGGLYSDDIVLKNSGGKAYPMVETSGYGGISESNAGKVQPGVEAQTTAVYEVPKGEKGLSLVYHQFSPDGFTCAIR
jgi:hypothetical protein